MGRTDSSQPCFAALEHRFTVQCRDPRVRTELLELLEPFAVGGRPVTTYEVLDDTAGGLRLLHDGETVAAGVRRSDLSDWLLWHVNQTAIALDTTHVLLHAAVTAWDGVAVVMPADSGAGKSSLAAATLQRGADYLSDELAVIDRGSLELTAYPKPLSLGLTAAAAIGEPRFCDRSGATGGRPSRSSRRHLPVARRARASSARVGAVVVPRFAPDEPTALRRMDRDDALLHLLGRAFGFEAQPQSALWVLARIAGSVPSYVATTGDLPRAAQLVEELLGDLPARTAVQPVYAHA